MEEQLKALEGHQVSGMIYHGTERRGYVLGMLETTEGTEHVWRIRQTGKQLSGSFGFLVSEVTKVSGNTITICIP